jgi:hypothetical protein
MMTSRLTVPVFTGAPTQVSPSFKQKCKKAFYEMFRMQGQLHTAQREVVTLQYEIPRIPDFFIHLTFKAIDSSTADISPKCAGIHVTATTLQLDLLAQLAVARARGSSEFGKAGHHQLRNLGRNLQPAIVTHSS